LLNKLPIRVAVLGGLLFFASIAPGGLTTAHAESASFVPVSEEADRLSKEKFEAGNACYANGDYKGAIKFYSESIKLNPDLATPYCCRGLAYDEIAEYMNAVDDFSKAIEIEPTKAEAYLRRGIAYIKLEDYPHTIADITEALNLGLDDNLADEAYLNRALAYDHSGDYAHAVEDYTENIRLIDDPLIYINRAWSYYNMGDYDHGIADLETALKYRPGDRMIEEGLERMRTAKREAKN